MKRTIRPRNKNSKAAKHDPILIFAVITVITFFSIICLTLINGEKKQEGILVDVASTKGKSEAHAINERQKPNDLNVSKKDTAFKSSETNMDGPDNDAQNSSLLSDEMIQGLSLDQLDDLHKKQSQNILKELSNPKNKVELPPSDDSSPGLSFFELNALHERQTVEIGSNLTGMELQLGDETSEGTQEVVDINEINMVHREQAAQINDDSKTVSLPSVEPENEFSPFTLHDLDERIHREQLTAEFAEVDDKAPIALPPSSDEPHPLTNWELIELHVKQEQMSSR